ncbi:Ferritin, heavy subunit [Astathelohania contejeani]|uniref:Ferritin n=1 Tax=Astathelohania contejeani TaxID=164912 RepID=A0ABQ7I2J5_9MICR|nr:Ferritin, heavy subunit [Thelohania contejeani]
MDENLKKEFEELLSKQLSIEYGGFYLWNIIAAYCDRPNVALKGMNRFYTEMYKEEINHIRGIVDFMNNCGMKIYFKPINSPYDTFTGLVDILEKTLSYEQHVYDHILLIHRRASETDQSAICNLLDEYVNEKVEGLKKFQDMVVNAKRCATSELGVYLFDSQFKKNK